MVSLLITILVLFLIFGLIAWIIRTAPFIDEPYKSFALWALVVVFVIVIILKLVPLAGVNLG